MGIIRTAPQSANVLPPRPHRNVAGQRQKQYNGFRRSGEAGYAIYKKAAQDDADVQAAVKKVTEELGDTGRILVRESGTEPVVRVMVEAESEEVCQKYVDMVVGVISEKGYVVE